MKLKFIKLATRWFVHLPDYDGAVDDLEMVAGADSLCYELDKDADGVVDVEVSETDDIKYDCVLDFMFSTTDESGEQDGAFYNVSEADYTQQLWLCNATKYIFKKSPPILYIKLING